jgi:tetratricopeptide (TPR) repeat protein
MMSLTRTVSSALVVFLLATDALHAQERLASARALYASAEYEQALDVLNRLPESDASDSERQQIELYRTLCLFAVGRRADADRTIESIILRDPRYQPGNDLPPRARAAFSDARKRLLPALVQQQYGEAKTAFDRNDFDAAAAGFRRVIDALDDPDLGAAGKQPPLADLRTLAGGFYDLSVKSLAPPPAPPAPVAAIKVEAAATPSARTFTGEEAGVRPPVPISQELPTYQGVVPANGLKGVVEIVIDETGHVQSASMSTPVQAHLDPMGRFAPGASAYHNKVLAAAKQWRFEPATMNGVPVSFRKRVQINVTPPAPPSRTMTR